MVSAAVVVMKVLFESKGLGFLLFQVFPLSSLLNMYFVLVEFCMSPVLGCFCVFQAEEIDRTYSLIHWVVIPRTNSISQNASNVIRTTASYKKVTNGQKRHPSKISRLLRILLLNLYEINNLIIFLLIQLNKVFIGILFLFCTRRRKNT